MHLNYPSVTCRLGNLAQKFDDLPVMLHRLHMRYSLATPRSRFVINVPVVLGRLLYRFLYYSRH